VDWHKTIFELIDTRSFSSLWFWIVLIVVWSIANHRVLGIPFDMVDKARCHGGQTADDLEELIRIKTNRLLIIRNSCKPWMLGIICFVHTGLWLLGFFYGIEFAQALFLLCFHLTLIGVLDFLTAQYICEEKSVGEKLYFRLSRHRIFVRTIGIVSIFITALWGMYQNIALGVFGS
jgi:hypothetical protein